jgi:hypothetical protein
MVDSCGIFSSETVVGLFLVAERFSAETVVGLSLVVEISVFCVGLVLKKASVFSAKTVSIFFEKTF